MNHTPKSSRPLARCWQFSLRTLLLLALAAAVVFAGFGWRWRRAQRQAAIVEQLRTTGVARVMYDYQIRTSGEDESGLGTKVPLWLRNRLGEDFFSDVHSLSITPRDRSNMPLEKRDISSEVKCVQALELAAPLSQIRTLLIQDTVVRGDALAKLTCWENLTTLRIDGCDLRDDDLVPLSRAVNLLH